MSTGRLFFVAAAIATCGWFTPITLADRLPNDQSPAAQSPAAQSPVAQREAEETAAAAAADEPVERLLLSEHVLNDANVSLLASEGLPLAAAPARPAGFSPGFGDPAAGLSNAGLANPVPEPAAAVIALFLCGLFVLMPLMRREFDRGAQPRPAGPARG